MAAMKWLDNRVRQVFGLFQAGQEQPTLRGERSPPPKFVLDDIGDHRCTLDAAAAPASDACSPEGMGITKVALFLAKVEKEYEEVKARTQEDTRTGSQRQGGSPLPPYVLEAWSFPIHVPCCARNLTDSVPRGKLRPNPSSAAASK
eukprot:4018251-Pyramimonas_sp.AAC.1